MVNKYLKSFGLQASAALLLACGQAVADDTEIYTGNGGDGAPLVFFNIEYTSSMASTICTGVLEDNPATIDVNEENIDTQCPAIAPLKSYMAANDIVNGVDEKIDQFELTRAALKRVLIELGHDTYAIKVGLLMAHDNLASCSGGPAATQCSQGGYILKGLTRLMAKSASFDAATATRAQVAAELALPKHVDKKALFAKLDAIPSPLGGFSHPNQNKEIYFELFRYLTGQGIYNGKNGWADFGTGNDGFNLGALNDPQLTNYNALTPAKGTHDCISNCVSSGVENGTTLWALNAKNLGLYTGDFIKTNGSIISTLPFKWDTSIMSGSNYLSALSAACEKVYVINVVDGGGNSANDADTAIKASLSSGGMGITNLANGDTGFEQMVAWLRDKDLADGTIGTAPNLTDIQNVTSYFVAKQPQQVDQAAQYGGTGFAFQLKDDAQSVANDILAIFKSIIDASTTFTSAAIPVNVFNRSEVVDNAYIALFQPNGDGDPRWVGNVKKLKMQIYVQCNVYDAKDPTKCIQSENRLRMTDTRTEVINGQTVGMNAISDTTGRVVPEALTYWTNQAGYDLYDNITTTNGQDEVPGYDGRSVHRGGAGQKIPGMLGTTADASGHLPRGMMNWTNTTGGRNLFTEPDDGSAPHSALLPLEWSNIGTFWPYLYNTATDDNYDVAPHWQTTYNNLGAVTPLSSTDWVASSALFNQNPTIATTTIKKYYNSDGTVAEINGASFTISHLASKLLAFMRGFDANDDDADTDILESRRWLFGDPLHSRPLAINYGTRDGYREDDPATPDVNESNPDIRIVVGSNDGYLRMLKNTGPGTGQTAEELGEEVWAFMPREAMKIQKQLMDNGAASLPDHPYGTDGAPSYFIRDNDGTIGYCKSGTTLVPCSSDQAWVYFGMRRGGRAYYGLDITNPDDPKFLWKITNNTPGFSELGYTFAQPVVRELVWGSYTDRRPVVIFGGGYDLNKDNQVPLLGSNDTMGRAIYIVDAETGALVWKADSSNGLTDSIPSKVTAIDSTGDSVIDRIYVGDTGGRVWRVDLPTKNTSDWTVTAIMNVGRHDPQWTTTADQTANDRRFFYAPDVIPTLDGKGNFDAVVIGSGNREHPTQTQTTDYIYMYKDRCISQKLSTCTSFVGPATMTNTISPTSPAFYDVTDNCIQENGGQCSVDPDLTYGWRLKLEGMGEKLLSSTLTVRGVVYFSSYLPKTSAPAGACQPAEGEGYVYAVALQDAVAVFDYDKTNTVVVLGEEYNLQKTDRKRKLDSPGIPAENVYVAYKDEKGKTINCVLGSDLNCGQDIGVQQWSSYWYESLK